MGNKTVISCTYVAFILLCCGGHALNSQNVRYQGVFFDLSLTVEAPHECLIITGEP